MWTSKAVSTMRPAQFLKNGSNIHFPHRLWNRDNSTNTARKPFTNLQMKISSYASRLIRAFDRRFFCSPILRRTNLMFGTLLENRLVQVLLADFGRTVVRSRDMLLSAACLSVYNWEDNSIPDHQIEEYFSDLEFVSQLTLETLTCKSCHLRLRIDQKVPKMTYCTCRDGTALNLDFKGWKPFIERTDTLVWRKEHETYKGLYAYKMYGKLDEVTAIDFLRIQLDTEFRKQWDTSATELKIIEESSETNSDLVYWEMQWPRPFANRDYVFQRRLTFNPNSNVCVLSSAGTSHTAIPVNKSMHRVTEYWSFMVVRPFTDFNKPGVEFVLTYFDNPGLSIPSSVSTWVAMTGLPNFVSRLREAAAKVVDLTGPEPNLLRCLRQQLDTRDQNILTAVEQRESCSVQIPGEEAPSDEAAKEQPVTLEEETSILTVFEEPPQPSESQAPLLEDSSNPDAVDSISQKSGDYQEETSAATGELGRVPSIVPGNPTVSTSCSPQTSENPQFLPNPVYA